MAEQGVMDSDDDNILYDLLVNTEWPAETDTQVGGKHSLRKFYIS